MSTGAVIVVLMRSSRAERLFNCSEHEGGGDDDTGGGDAHLGAAELLLDPVACLVDIVLGRGPCLLCGRLCLCVRAVKSILELLHVALLDSSALLFAVLGLADLATVSLAHSGGRHAIFYLGHLGKVAILLRSFFRKRFVSFSFNFSTNIFVEHAELVGGVDANKSE